MHIYIYIHIAGAVLDSFSIIRPYYPETCCCCACCGGGETLPALRRFVGGAESVLPSHIARGWSGNLSRSWRHKPSSSASHKLNECICEFVYVFVCFCDKCRLASR